jgi:hypothetical protein
MKKALVLVALCCSIAAPLYAIQSVRFAPDPVKSFKDCDIELRKLHDRIGELEDIVEDLQVTISTLNDRLGLLESK